MVLSIYQAVPVYTSSKSVHIQLGSHAEGDREGRKFSALEVL